MEQFEMSCQPTTLDVVATFTPKILLLICSLLVCYVREADRHATWIPSVTIYRLYSCHGINSVMDGCTYIVNVTSQG